MYPNLTRFCFIGASSLFLAGLLIFFRPMPAQAGGVVGNGTPGSCTETAFDSKLVGGGLVTFNCGGAKTIILTGYKEIEADTTIDGSGLITLSSNNSYLIQNFFGRTLILQNITLANSKSNVTGALQNFGTTTIINSILSNNQSTNQGGALYNQGTLNLINTTLVNNKATNAGGAIFNDGGVLNVNSSQFFGNVISGTTGTGGGIANNSGPIHIQNSIFSNNSGFDGGAIYVDTGATAFITASVIISNSAGYGAGVENNGTTVISRTLISLNQAINEGGGLWNLSGLLTVRDSTISDNKAGTTGGGISHQGASLTLNRVTVNGNTAGTGGGGIYSEAAAGLTNVTLSGNKATNPNGGGGIYQAQGNVLLNYVTVANNTATFGAGVYKDGLLSGTMFLANSLLSNNSTGNCDGVVGSNGHNLSSDTNCGSFTQTGDQQNISLPLGILAHYGGPTPTHLLLTGNPAINGGSCLGGITTDQRGLARSYGATCDVGAVELQPLPVYTPVVLKKS